MSGDTATDRRRHRYRVSAIILIAAGGLLAVRYGAVMIFGEESSAATTETAVMERGPILDRNGRILAIQTQLDTVTAWKPAIEDIPATATLLASILAIDPDELENRLLAANGFITIERTITPSRSAAIREAQERGELQGIQLEADAGRSYPERDAAAPVIGYVGVDNRGLSGIEYLFAGDLLPDPATDGPRATMGNQVFLTLDLAIQSAADDLATRLVEEHQADSVIILVAEADTGDMLAIASQPSFDLNRYREYTAEQRRNRPVASIYEPGSVFKAFTVAAFLELGGIDLDDTFNTSGGYVADGGRFVISDLADYGVLDTAGIIRFSSNVGAAYASERVSADAFYGVLRAFGFGEPTEIEMNGEEAGLLAPPERWSARTQQTLAIGQEIGVTAIQVVAAATALANDGILLRPQIVDRIVSPSGVVVRRFERVPVREVLSPGTARTMLRLMQLATRPGGTARRIQLDGVPVAAKTGTAEVFDPDIGSYSDEHFVASTLAILPADNPELIIYVVIDYPRGESFLGGRIAAPAVDELAEFLVPYWNVPRTGDTVIEHPGTIVASQPRLPELADRVPDYTGLPIRTLLPLLARDDLDITIRGSGWVVRQEPPPGTQFRPEMSIVLELE